MLDPIPYSYVQKQAQGLFRQVQWYAGSQGLEVEDLIQIGLEEWIKSGGIAQVRNRMVDEIRRWTGRRAETAKQKAVKGIEIQPLQKFSEGTWEDIDVPETVEPESLWVKQCREYAVKHLNARELTIYDLYLEDWTLKEIGEKLGLTEARVCQLRKEIQKIMLPAA